MINLKTIFTTTIWLTGLFISVAGLLMYAHTPGNEPLAKTLWPAESRIPLNSFQPTLLVFLHPKCNCSKATVGELETMMPALLGKAQIKVYFMQYQDKNENWVKSDLWNTVKALPSVEVGIDFEGKEAAIFGAKTSGHTLLYTTEGKLIFNGGITAARGHRGDNVGKENILNWFKKRSLASEVTPTFGCDLDRKKTVALINQDK